MKIKHLSKLVLGMLSLPFVFLLLASANTSPVATKVASPSPNNQSCRHKGEKKKPKSNSVRSDKRNRVVTSEKSVSRSQYALQILFPKKLRWQDLAWLGMYNMLCLVLLPIVFAVGRYFNAKRPKEIVSCYAYGSACWIDPNSKVYKEKERVYQWLVYVQEQLKTVILCQALQKQDQKKPLADMSLDEALEIDLLRTRLISKRCEQYWNNWAEKYKTQYDKAFHSFLSSEISPEELFELVIDTGLDARSEIHNALVNPTKDRSLDLKKDYLKDYLKDPQGKILKLGFFKNFIKEKTRSRYDEVLYGIFEEAIGNMATIEINKEPACERVEKWKQTIGYDDIRYESNQKPDKTWDDGLMEGWKQEIGYENINNEVNKLISLYKNNARERENGGNYIVYLKCLFLQLRYNEAKALLENPKFRPILEEKIDGFFINMKMIIDMPSDLQSFFALKYWYLEYNDKVDKSKSTSEKPTIALPFYFQKGTTTSIKGWISPVFFETVLCELGLIFINYLLLPPLFHLFQRGYRSVYGDKSFEKREKVFKQRKQWTSRFLMTFFFALLHISKKNSSYSNAKVKIEQLDCYNMAIFVFIVDAFIGPSAVRRQYGPVIVFLWHMVHNVLERAIVRHSAVNITSFISKNN